LKYDLPNHATNGANNLSSERDKYNTLSSTFPRTVNGNLTWTSTTTGTTYNTATYDGGTFANQGEEGLMLLLKDVLAEYMLVADDYNDLSTEISTNITELNNKINLKFKKLRLGGMA
jgi:hypothetical protein